MSDERLPPLPPGFLPGTPAAPTPSEIPPLPQNFVPGNAPQQPWKASILPFSTDATGKANYFDLSAGIIGKALDAFALPRNVYTGQQQIYDPGTGTFDPSFVDRNLNFAQMASPQPASSRLSVAPYRTMSTETRVGEGGPLSGPLLSSRVGPTGEQLKTVADAGYDAARASTTTIPSSSVASYGTAAARDLQDNFGLVPKTAPKTFAVLDDLAHPSGQTRYIDLEASRRQLNAIKSTAMGDSDAFAAQKAIDHLDKLIDPIFPAAATARGNQAAAFRASDITGDLTRANTGILERGDTAAQLRQRVKTFTQSEGNLRGFNDAEIAALNDFADGKGVLNTALNKTGNLIGGGFGKLASGVIGAVVGSNYGPAGTAAGILGAPWLGEGFKSLEAARASAQLNAIAQQLRSRSPLGEQMLEQNVRAPSSFNRAILPLVTPPPMAPQPQRQFPPMQPADPNAPGPPRPTGGYFQPYGGPDPGPQRFPFGTPLPQGLLSGWS